jgi:hypothetical protein
MEQLQLESMGNLDMTFRKTTRLEITKRTAEDKELDTVELIRELLGMSNLEKGR